MERSLLRSLFVKYIGLYLRKCNGAEFLPRKGRILVVANQNSISDAIFINYLFYVRTKRLVNVVSKFKDTTNSRLNKLVIKIGEKLASQFVGIISVLEKNAIKNSVHQIRRGKRILIFPEGRCNDKNVLLKGRTGAARIALLSKATVIPIGVIGSGKFLPVNSYFPRFKRVTINIGKPISLEEYYGQENDRAALEKITRVFMTEVGKLSGKEYPY